MTVQPLFQWIEQTELAMWINNSKYAFAVIECFHILALAIIGGAIVMVDARLLGYGFRNQKVSEVAAAARPWLIGSLILIIITGYGMSTTPWFQPPSPDRNSTTDFTSPAGR